MQTVDLLITNATVVTMDTHYNIYSPGALAIRGDTLVAVGAQSMILESYTAPTILNVKGKTITPGLMNAHTHAAMTLLRGIADDLRLDVWLLGFMMPVEREFVNPDMVRLGTKLAAAEMIRSGVVAFADMYYYEAEVARATAEAGLRAIAGQTILKFPSPDAASFEDSLAYTREFIQEWKDHPLIVPAVSPHAPYTCTAEILRSCAELAAEYDVPLHIHIGETAKEVEDHRHQYGMPIIPWVKKQHLFDAKVLAAHCVHLDQGELRTLANHKASIAHNPTSNLKLASGIAPVIEMLKTGLNVGIGTDGPASNNDLDMFEEMRLAALLAKGATLNPTALPAREAFAMATSMGARAMFIGDRTGSLEPGKRADFAVIDLNALHNLPTFDRDPNAIYSRLVYAAKAHDVTDLMVNGQWLMRDRMLLTLNEADLIAEAQEFAHHIDRFLIQREKSVLSKLLALTTPEREASFEVQIKARIPNPEPVLHALNSDELTLIRHVHYREYDTYFLFDHDTDRLRIREDDVIGDNGQITDVRYSLTLLGPAKEADLGDSALLSRSRFVAPSPHTLRFYREYFQPTGTFAIQKKRLRWQVAYRGVEFFINLDELLQPDLGYFLEIKSRTWSRRDAEDKARLINELIVKLGADPAHLLTQDYAELVEARMHT